MKFILKQIKNILHIHRWERKIVPTNSIRNSESTIKAEQIRVCRCGKNEVWSYKENSWVDCEYYAGQIK